MSIQVVEADAAVALEAFKGAAPDIVKVVPELGPFLPFIGLALHAIHVMEKVQGGTTGDAVSSVATAMAVVHPDVAGSIAPDHIEAAGAAVASGIAADAIKALQAQPVPVSAVSGL
jgi:hypothetical protein